MSVLYLMAAPAEYGAHLKQRIDPVFIGVGPVEAAIATTKALAERRDAMPQMVVCLGSAGSNRLEQCGVYQAISVSYRDMDASALGFPRGTTPFLDLPPTLPLVPAINGLTPATLSTGGNVVTGPQFDQIVEDMVDMETFAVKRACQAFGVPLLGLRGISDGRDAVSRIEDWTRYLHIIDERLAQAVDCVETLLARGEVDLTT
ncbi:5'-methylthioadenosine nucleosidase [Devosia soli]|uniref:5'-methylthioadenosine nucleosidase n=1 Tax=Devosia soli TaxID=361041 RepID=A0A0F5L5C5_9HYPH|nr:5'-methylthioadenosine/S-adenosylhomocysteine nucleosidase [Devosia soli]KKB77419.1 5'-methylthioadenosine nucleosidase [Devosia soli]